MLWVHLAFRRGLGRNFAFKLLRRRADVPDSVKLDNVRDGAYSAAVEGGADLEVTFRELETLVAGIGARPKQPVIRIRADQTLQYQQVVRLMSLLMRNNITKITFDTQAE